MEAMMLKNNDFDLHLLNGDAFSLMIHLRGVVVRHDFFYLLFLTCAGALILLVVLVVLFPNFDVEDLLLSLLTCRTKVR